MGKLYSDEILVAYYLKYKTQTKAAARLGVGRETVARAVRRAGIKMNGRIYNMAGGDRVRKITDEQLAEDSKTMSCREIAVKYEMCDEQVYRRAKAAGITLDTRGTGGHWKKRAERYGVALFDSSITLKECVKRFNGICQICGEPVDSYDIKGGHIRRLYPTVDHIIPLSRGGSHTWENVQLAHMSCNAGKCAK